MSNLVEAIVRSSNCWELVKLEGEYPRGEPILLMNPRVGGVDNPEIDDPLLIIYAGQAVVSNKSKYEKRVSILASEYAFVTKKDGKIVLRGSAPGTAPKMTKLMEYDLKEKVLDKESLGVKDIKRNESVNHLYCTPTNAYIGRDEVVPKLREILNGADANCRNGKE